MAKNSITITIGIATVIVSIFFFTWNKAVGYGILAAQVEDVIEEVCENKDDIKEGEGNLNRLADTVTSFIGEQRITNNIQSTANARLAEMVEELKKGR